MVDNSTYMNPATKHGRTKSARIASALEDMILSGRLGEGQSLPSQQELAQQFDASSRSIREAFKQLEAKGLLTVSQGRRASIKSNNLDQFVSSLSDTIIRSGSSNNKLMLDLIQVCTSVEVSATRDISRNPNRREVVSSLVSISNLMVDLLPDLKKRDRATIEDYLTLESEFHKVLVRSNDNIILNAIYENLSPLLDQSMSYAVAASDDCEKKVREYQYIAEALGAGQTDLAVALVLVNLTNMKKRIEANAAKEKVARAMA